MAAALGARRVDTRTRDTEPFSFAQTAYDGQRSENPTNAPPGNTNDSLVGRRIDHFQIQAVLGQGGMGTVYLAHDLSLQRPVALKVLRRELGDNTDLIERLVLEAQAQAGLQHPHVVGVYYIGAFAGTPYFAMEYVRGESLAERIERGPLPWPEALEYVIQTTRALMEAHERGIVHRDVKPSNLLLTTFGQKAELGHLKVADFGLAAQRGRQQEYLVGSPYYASPEQLAGKAPNHRSDIYSLGITFYELLTGAPPFEAESFGELVRLHESAARPEIPENRAPWRLRRLIAEMMNPVPSERPWTYEELLDRLSALRPRDVVAGGVAARAMALAVDAGLAAAAAGLLRLFGMHLFSALALAFLLWGTHAVIGQALFGQTLGKRLMRLRLQGSTRPINVRSLTVRFFATLWGPILAAAVTLLEFGVHQAFDLSVPFDLSLPWGVYVPQALLLCGWALGLAAAAIDPERRALHDRLARTRVIYSMRSEASPSPPQR
jgi:uncharacterized RDD family membrane protein YckC